MEVEDRSGADEGYALRIGRERVRVRVRVEKGNEGAYDVNRDPVRMRLRRPTSDEQSNGETHRPRNHRCWHRALYQYLRVNTTRGETLTQAILGLSLATVLVR